MSAQNPVVARALAAVGSSLLFVAPFAARAQEVQEAAIAADEAAYYKVDFLPTTPGMVEVGGLDFLSDGRLVVSTRHGQVWIVENPTAADPAGAKLKLFAEGLYEGLGLAVVDGEICVLQRTELSRLLDGDHDGRCDTVETICDDWGVSGN